MSWIGGIWLDFGFNLTSNNRKLVDRVHKIAVKEMNSYQKKSRKLVDRVNKIAVGDMDSCRKKYEILIGN